ncbi:hypothetical protein D3C72_1990280 [compost metagenome]
MNGLAQVVDDAHLEQFVHVERAQFLLECHGHQAQPPAVFGGALRSAGRRMRASEHALETLGLAQELQLAQEVLACHGFFGVSLFQTKPIGSASTHVAWGFRVCCQPVQITSRGRMNTCATALA